MSAQAEQCGSGGARSWTGFIRQKIGNRIQEHDEDVKLGELRINTCGSKGELRLRRRFQKGSLQQVRGGKAKRWVVLYYNTDGKRQYHTLHGAGSMTKTQAEKERDEFMRTINGCDEPDTDGLRPVSLGEFIERTYLVFQRRSGKRPRLARPRIESGTTL
jgi:hypothetical protein